MSAMDIKALNNQIARILIAKNIVTREVVRSFAPEVKPGHDLGQVLVKRGMLNENQYKQIYNHVVAQLGGPPAQAPAQSSQPEPSVPRETAPPRHAPPKTAAPPKSGSERQIPPKTRKRPTDKAKDLLPSQFRENYEISGTKQTVPEPTAASTLEEIMIFARQKGASDLHLNPDSPIMLRRFGRLIRIGEPLRADQIEHIIENALDASKLEELKSEGDLELAYTVPNHGRFRTTFSEERFGWNFTCRVIDSGVRPFDTTGLPSSTESLTHWAQGLVLLTGPLGCGKSSTMATLVELVNQDRHEHIITIENPIEIIFKPKKCQISQREVDRHTLSPANALRGALRQDPDILMVGELRDLETIRLAVSAAETGHLVFGTMNTTNATRTINRLIESFPPNEQVIVRTMISESLRGVISQQLVPLKDGTGVVPAYEVLIITKAISNMIRKEATHQIESAMVSGRQMGMVLLDDSLKNLVDKGLVEGSEAFYRATNPKNFKAYAPENLREILNA